MGVLSTNRAQITSGGIISASFISDVYDVLTGVTSETTVFSGSLSISGSLNTNSGFSGSFTGSLTGLATSASYVAAANVDGTVTNATSASISTTAITSSFVASTLTFGTGSSLGTVINGALAVSSSGDLYFGSASAWYKVTLG